MDVYNVLHEITILNVTIKIKMNLFNFVVFFVDLRLVEISKIRRLVEWGCRLEIARHSKFDCIGCLLLYVRFDHPSFFLWSFVVKLLPYSWLNIAYWDIWISLMGDFPSPSRSRFIV